MISVGDALVGRLGPQGWQRDAEGPCVSLGEAGAFDDTHIFAPCVAFEDGVYRLWYCGSQGTVAKRVFRVGLATSEDGVHFVKHPASPVLEFPDASTSVLTPTLLRDATGSALREGGRLRMWFAATDFPTGDGTHTLHESTSEDGLAWTVPSEPQLDAIYAPTVLNEDDRYLMWYTDVSSDPWSFRHATSRDGRSWDVVADPVLELGQGWERGRLFYPTVLKRGALYEMWYGSYQAQDPNKTALGHAVSEDGVTWARNPHNPIYGPNESREWESHFTTSESVMLLEDGSLRIWYASRTRPPFDHKYFAIGTAVWAAGQ